ncbi:T9SS type A sorting domain-containing protein [Formosa undariae]|uniref:T9SS type A sorting domain-containing protein n=1 Tax=Formosa undariae TaxID=1325436 RepID=A0ABV5F6B6_9FLAO
MKQTLLSLCLMASLSVFAQETQPVVQNGNFYKIAKSSGSECGCSQWINKDLGDQPGSSTSGLTTEEKEYNEANDPDKNALKYDAGQADLIYQEIAVVPNKYYILTYEGRIDSVDDDQTPSDLEIRILKGSAYVEDYSPTYYTDATEQPQRDFGYRDISETEKTENNLIEEIIKYPGDNNRVFYQYTFNSGDETSIAIMSRGIGGNAGYGDYNWSTGDATNYVYSITLENIGSTLSVSDNAFAAGLKVFPNPASSSINIKSGNGTQINSVELYNVLGSKVLSASNLVNNAIDVSEIASGIYILKVNGADRTSVSKRVIIE